MYFCPEDRGEMASMVYNWESDEVDAVVVTDGSRCFIAALYISTN
jgi:malate dehydrogenase (decarboxylating)